MDKESNDQWILFFFVQVRHIYKEKSLILILDP